MNIVFMRYMSIVLVMVYSIIFIPAYAENGKTFEVPAKKDEIEEIQFKDEMEARMSRDLRAYLGNNRFIIHVEAEIKKTRTVIKEGGNNEKNDKNIPNRPVFSTEPVTAANQAPEEDSLDEELPGLPFSDIPRIDVNNSEVDVLVKRVKKLQEERQQALGYADSLRKAAEKKIEHIKQKTLGYRNSIKKLTITLVLDKSLSDEQVAFVRNLVTRKSRLDALRGDSLNVVRTQFKEVVSDVNYKAPQWWDKYQVWILLSAFVMLMVLLLLSLYVFNKRLIDSLKESRRRSESFDDLTVPAAVDMAPIVQKEKSKGAEKQRKLSEIRQELVTIGLGQPQLFQKKLMANLSQGDYQSISALYSVMGGNLFRSLCPSLSSKQLNDLSEHMDKENLDADQTLIHLSDIHQSLLRELSKDDNSCNMPFTFLEKLNDSQVLFLLKEEEHRIKALVLSQLPASRAAKLVQRMTTPEQASVAYELGQFESLPVTAFKDVADRLAKKSLSVPSFENVSADGLSVLISMLDTMSSGEETKLLRTMKSDQPETYYRLRQAYYSYVDLMRTPDNVIANELRDIDRQILARSLCHTPIDFKRHVISGLSPKLRSSVVAELKEYESNASKTVVEQARSQVVNKMREVLKSGRLSMDELAPISEPS